MSYAAIAGDLCMFRLRLRLPTRLSAISHRQFSAATCFYASTPATHTKITTIMAPPQPELPHPAHIDHDSALGRKFGKEVVNYFGSSPLNRISFLRDDYEMLAGAFDHSSAKFMVFNNLSPMIDSPTEIHYVTLNDVKSLFPENPYSKGEKELEADFDSSKTIPQLVFLGIDEKVEDGYKYRNYTGAPYFALDITPNGTYKEEAQKLIDEFTTQKVSFVEGMRAMSFPAEVAAAYAQGRHYLDWNSRNTYCGTCGHKTLSVNGGSKRVCPSTDKAESPSERPACSTRTTLSNLTFPRTDPTIIVAVLSHDSKRLLLGRQKRWPKYWFSTLAGFVEPAESVEDAVRREVWEESGVILSRVLIHSTQPWPYPANLMIGAIAQVARPEDETIKLDNDPELETAKWFGLDEIKEALENGTSVLGEEASANYKEGNLRLPPRTAIAHQLITAVVEGGFLEGVTPLATASKI